MPLAFALVLFGISGVFLFHLVRGWRSGSVCLPISILSFEEFEREQSSANYWGVMFLNAFGAFAVFGLALFGVIRGQWS